MANINNSFTFLKYQLLNRNIFFYWHQEDLGGGGLNYWSWPQLFKWSLAATDQQISNIYPD